MPLTRTIDNLLVLVILISLMIIFVSQNLWIYLAALIVSVVLILTGLLHLLEP